MKQTDARVISNEELIPRVYLLWLDCPGIASKARPGQFVMVRCGEGAEYQLRRPLSIHQQDENRFALPGPAVEASGLASQFPFGLSARCASSHWSKNALAMRAAGIWSRPGNLLNSPSL